MAEKKTAIIVGAGPAGLTAAFELLKRTDVKPVILEASDEIGGISRTIKYKGNRIDIGGHRFFSKSDRVMNWWMSHMPVDPSAAGTHKLGYQQKTRDLEIAKTDTAKDDDRVMLVRERKSRIYYLRRFFDYPISLSVSTLRNLGARRTVRIGLSYVKAAARPIPNEQNLEQFLINRFGKELYLTFFKSYTEKVWGTACDAISAEWGAQRIKGLNVRKAITNAVSSVVRKKDLEQKNTETSLIEKFLYPKFGPGQMWETVAETVKSQGCEIHMHHVVERIHTSGDRVVGVTARNTATNASVRIDGDIVFSTMPVKELVRAWDAEVPAEVKEVSEGLLYRDFITVGLLLDDIKLKETTAAGKTIVRDNWIYIQEPDVVVGRLQIFNNWSPFMVADPTKVWIGLEYFCNEGDALWTRNDEQMIAFAKDEMERIGIIDKTKVRDAVVVRQPKTYPAYFGSYDRFPVIRQFVDRFANLYLIGRNGMHKYNNQDHSMLTAMVAVDNIAAGTTDKDNVWSVNTEGDYHEEKAAAERQSV